MKQVEECLICGKKLKYLNESEEMECVICGKKVMSKACCVDGHFVCDECHNKGVDLIKFACLSSSSKNPYEIITDIMKKDFIHMHGPEHHTLVGAALLTAYKNAGGDIDLEKALKEMEIRGQQVPGGACGFWGACGAGVSVGIFISIITEASPLTTETWGQSNLATSEALKKIGEVGGPRCCKRDSYLAIGTAIDFVADKFGISMEKSDVTCQFSNRNAQCIGKRCPFNPKNK